MNAKIAFLSTSLAVAISVIASLSAQAAPSEACTLYKEGAQLYTDGNFAESEKKFQEASAKEPGNAEIFRMLGLCRKRQGDVAGATDYLNKSVATAPKSIPGNYSRHLIVTVSIPAPSEDEGMELNPESVEYEAPSEGETYYRYAIESLPLLKGSKSAEKCVKTLMEKRFDVASAPFIIERNRSAMEENRTIQTPVVVLNEENEETAKIVMSFADAAFELAKEYKKSGNQKAATETFRMIADSPAMRVPLFNEKIQGMDSYKSLEKSCK